MYPVELLEIVEKQTEYGDRLQFTLSVAQEGPYHKRTLWTFCNAEVKLTPKAKLTQIAEAFLGGELPVGAALDLDDLVGCHALAMVEIAKDKLDEPINKVLKLSPWDGTSEGHSDAVAEMVITEADEINAALETAARGDEGS
jgi:hypothetical protein